MSNWSSLWDDIFAGGAIRWKDGEQNQNYVLLLEYLEEKGVFLTVLLL
jgi:hypothetical protein